MSLPNLPHELLLSISDVLEKFRYINALNRTSKRLYSHLNHHLYSLDVRTRGGSALRWAAKHESKHTARLSLAEGADIEALDLVTIPCRLRCLGFYSRLTSLTPLQTALCYGSDSVATTLIHHGAICSSPYPTELGNCTNLHMAAATGLTFALKILVDRGLNVEALDMQLRTPLHYAATTQPRNSLDKARVVMLLLANDANPEKKDSRGLRPISIGKRRSNVVVRMLSESGAATQAYETSLQDQELFRVWRIAKKRREETEWAEKLKEKQLDVQRTTREWSRRKEKTKVTAEQRSIATRSQEREGMERQNSQSIVQACAKDQIHQLAAAQRVVETKEVVEFAWPKRQEAAREEWSRLRKEADQRIRVTNVPDLLTKANCKHISGLWRCRTRKTCQSCGISAKMLSLCTDCGVVLCTQCSLGN
jgi:hypothetical protein